jgi:hypothetical protein
MKQKKSAAKYIQQMDSRIGFNAAAVAVKRSHLCVSYCISSIIARDSTMKPNQNHVESPA